MVLFIKILWEGIFKIFSGNDNPYCIVFENLTSTEANIMQIKTKRIVIAYETFLQRPLHVLS